MRLYVCALACASPRPRIEPQMHRSSPCAMLCRQTCQASANTPQQLLVCAPDLGLLHRTASSYEPHLVRG